MLINISSNKLTQTKEKLEEFYKVRKEIFIDRLQWDLPHADGKEIDQFDHDKCSYLISCEGENVIGGARLTPSIYPNLTFDYFKDHFLIPPSLGRDENLLELSRFGLKSFPQKTTIGIINPFTLELLEGIFKFCLDHGYKKIIAVTEIRIERLFKFLGTKMERISDIKLYGNTQVFIGLINIHANEYEKIKLYSSKYRDIL